LLTLISLYVSAHAEARAAAISPLRDDADAAMVVPHIKNPQRQSNPASRGHRSTTSTTAPTTHASAVAVAASSSSLVVGDVASPMGADDVQQPQHTDVEEYISGSASSENQLLYVVLGTVLGVVVLVTVVCIAMCMWKQQQHQRSIGNVSIPRLATSSANA
jgi:hypothetical protein